jgi:hypothetical protein
MHALNDMLQAAERERLGAPVFKFSKGPLVSPPGLRQDFLGVGVKLYSICFQRITNNSACLVVLDSGGSASISVHLIWQAITFAPAQHQPRFPFSRPASDIYSHSQKPGGLGERQASVIIRRDTVMVSRWPSEVERVEEAAKRQGRDKCSVNVDVAKLKCQGE